MNIKEKVYEILRDLSGLDEISDVDLLQMDLGLDSLNMVTLLIELEDCFNIEFEESDMNPFALKKVEDIVELIEKYLEVDNEEGCRTTNSKTNI